MGVVESDANVYTQDKLKKEIKQALSQETEAPDFEAPEQEFMMVRVPKGMPAGSIMQVEIPGENRTLAVTVPPNATRFHVAYSPTAKPSPPPPPAPAPVMMPRSAPVLAKAKVPQTVTPRPVPPSQKLLLVRVPPGTAPGATLHVSVPDEPGRILAAQVPPGNVPEFHVAYESRAKPAANVGMLPPANAYQPQNNEKSSFAPLDPSDESFGGYDF